MKVWITKYALVVGIIEKEAEYLSELHEGTIKTKSDRPSYYYGEGEEWHRTEESAIKKAEELRQKKIASLKKQIEKLEMMRFE